MRNPRDLKGSATHDFLLVLLTGSLFCLHGVAITVAQENMDEVPLGDDVFRVANEYELTQIAGPDLIRRPTVADWDHQGRLVVCESAGVHESTKDQLESKPHQVVRLIDEDGDGVFDRRLVAAKDLSFYSGVLCDGNDIYVSTPPSILKLTDSDGDGVCESRSVWHDGGTLTYCANDLHGPYHGPGGWIYWCKGAFGEQVHQLAGGKKLVSKAAHILRKRPEGGPVEIVVSGGMDNPIELAFLPSGETFFTSTFLQHPSGGRRDGIAHAVHGSLFGKDHDVLQGHFKTGDLMPVMIHLGPAAPSGLMRQRFGSPASPTLVCAQFNMHKVTSHRLIPDGATYRSEDRDLLSSSRLDFHPTDVLEDADGSLLVLDTGDWYDLCCPSSGAEGSRATGGIYRLRSKQSSTIEDPQGKRIDWAKLGPSDWLEQLNDDRPWVRDQAKEHLVDHGDESLPLMANAFSGQKPSFTQRMIQVLGRMQTDASQTMLADWLRRSLDQPTDSAIQHALLNTLSMRGIEDLRSVTRLAKESTSPAVRRAAVECLGRHGGTQHTTLLLDLVDQPADRTMHHSLVYALIEGKDVSALAAHANTEHHPRNARSHAAAMSVLNQVDDEPLEPSSVLAAVITEDPSLQRVAEEILIEHPEWAETLKDELSELTLPEGRSERSNALRRVLASWRHQPAMRSWWVKRINQPTDAEDPVLLLLSVPPGELSAAWIPGIVDRLENESSTRRAQLVNWLAKMRLNASDHGPLIDALEQTAKDPSLSLADRFQAAAALPSAHSMDGPLSERVIRAFLDGIDGRGDDADSQSASLAAAVLARVRLNESAAKTLLQSLDRVPAAYLTAAVASIVRASGATSRELLDVLPQVPTARTLSPGFLNDLYQNADPQMREKAKGVAEKLSQPPAKIAASLAALMEELPSGDAVRGMRVFHGAKAACGVCHEFGDVGGRVGPELTKIGKSRSKRDLLEAIVYPSSHIAQGYRSIRVLTVDGVIHNGVVHHETADTLQLTTGIQRVVTIPKDEIELREESDVSVMPAGLDGAMSKQELADVVELLTTYGAW